MAHSILASRTFNQAAERRITSFSLSQVASGYVPSLQPCNPCSSLFESTICSKGVR
jgi:hypothetical protein